MGEFLLKLEEYVFDIMGLILPGFIFLLLVSAPLLLFDFEQLQGDQYSLYTIIATLHVISTTLKDFLKLGSEEGKNFWLLLVILVTSSYIVGHLIKVFSVIAYNFLVMIFDKTINRIVGFTLNWLLRIIRFVGYLINSLWVKIFKRNLSDYRFFNTFLAWLKKDFSKPFIEFSVKLFTFDSQKYDLHNTFMEEKCKEIINKKLEVSFVENWYSLYKFSDILSKGEKIRSLSFIFLAKYNLYRSLSFMFLIIFIYYYIFFQASFLTGDILKIKDLILVMTILLWFTFNVKYKRYWTLCGNETLVSLFYYLNRDKLK